MVKVTSIYDYTPADPEEIKSPSMTVPGRSMSVKEILARFTSGLLAPEDINHSQFDYFDDDENPDDPHFDDPMDDLLYDGSTDISEVYQARQDALSSAVQAGQASDGEPGATDQVTTEKEERSDDADGGA